MTEPMYVESIMTIVFTSSGELALVKNKKGEIDTIPQYFLGRKELGSKGYNEETNIGGLNDLLDYEEEISFYFGKHDPRYEESLVDQGFFKGNRNAILDCGELAPSISKSQIQEMANLDRSSFIRVSRESYDAGVNDQGIDMINRMQVRYLVVPDSRNLSSYRDFLVITVEEFCQMMKREDSPVSKKLAWFMSGNDLERVIQFSKELESVEKRVQKV